MLMKREKMVKITEKLFECGERREEGQSTGGSAGEMLLPLRVLKKKRVEVEGAKGKTKQTAKNGGKEKG